MTFLSYAQNFEDVLLWRALQHVCCGFYLDIGAQDPIVDSVSKGFYEQGWRGVHVEPVPHYAELLRGDRPDETVIQAAVSDQPGLLRFYEIPDTGISTGSEEIASTHRRSGWKIAETLVSAITLDQIFDQSDSEDIHWLKIDVEGFEAAALNGWRNSPQRPWIVVVESTYPLERIETHTAWEHLLCDKGYSFVHFDGLSRYYLSPAHGDLEKHFRYGPCLWDEFQFPEISRRVGSLIQRQNRILNDIRAESETSIARQSEATAQAQATIVDLTQSSVELGGTLSKTRAELDQSRETLNQTRAELDQSRETLNQTRAELDQSRETLNRTRAELDQSRGKLDQITADKIHSDKEWSRQRARLVAEVEAIAGSVWWRLSVPFRRRSTLLAALMTEITSGRAFGADGVSPPVAHTLDELLAHKGEAFIQCAYATLLGRDIDPEGLRYFLGRLTLNPRRDAIVAELVLSAEGRRFGARMPGLDGFARRYRLLNKPIIGPLLKWLGITPRTFRFFSAGPITGAAAGHIASSIEELFSLHDEAFVRCVYATVLGRDPDPDGLRHHLAGIRNGESRHAILAGIRLSAEGQRRGAVPPGLDKEIRCYRLQRLPVLGPLLSLAGLCRERFDIRRKLSAIEARLDLLCRLAAPAAAEDAKEPQVDEAKLSSQPPAVAIQKAVPKARNSAVLEGCAWFPPLTWRFTGTFDGADEFCLIHSEISQALTELGHDVVCASSGSAVNITAFVGSPPVPTDTRDSRSLLVGHDWEESGYPMNWVDELNATVRGVACLSTHASKILVDHGVSVSVAAIGQGVDHWERILASPSYRPPGKRFRFLHVSSCDPGKGIDLLLESFGRVFASDDEVSLVIKPTGAAPDLSTFLEGLRQADPHFPDVVLIANNMTDAELKALYRQCQIFLAPSRAEGFGLPIAQAFLAGLPVLATAWGGHRDYCDETNSWLVDYRFQQARTPYDLIASVWAEPITDSLDKALWTAFRATPAERFAKSWSGRKRLMNRFTWKDAALRVAALADGAKLDASVEPSKSRVGWVTTWNVKCGIAGHVEQLLASIPADEVVVFAARQEPRISDDGANCLRTWNLGKEANGLDEIERELTRWSVDALIIHFNYGFFNHQELSDFLESVLARGIVVLIDFHSTIDPLGDVKNFRLSDMLSTLSKCHRLLVHGPADMNRLKALGLVDNVMLFPLGAINRGPGRAVCARQNDPPLIASFGFCFPDKGLLELIQAVSLLKDEGLPVRLRMLNAEYPSPQSAAATKSIKAAIEDFGLQDDIEIHTEFLENEVCVALLGEADLVVNPYQRSGESASAAVRYGLTACRPVAVTPLPIFDDLGDAVFRMPGTTPQQISHGIVDAMKHLREDSETARRVRNAARRWIEAHDCSRQAARLMRTARALVQQDASSRTAKCEFP